MNSITHPRHNTQKPWVRGQNGILAGVSQGLAERFAIDVMLSRLAWIFSVIFFGFGICAYIVLAIGLPREDKLSEAQNPRLLGVCSRFAKRFDLDIGLTRVGFLALLFATAGSAFLAYFVLHFILPKATEPVTKNDF